MKKTTKLNKLGLNKETIRPLDQNKLDEIKGGMQAASLQCNPTDRVSCSCLNC